MLHTFWNECGREITIVTSKTLGLKISPLALVFILWTLVEDGGLYKLEVRETFQIGFMEGVRLLGTSMSAQVTFVAQS